MKILLLMLCLTVPSCWTQSSCPASEDIKPCKCTDIKGRNPLISCEGLTKASDLIQAVKKMADYKFSSFDIEKSNIGVLPADTFSKMEIQFLNILFTNLTSISESLNRPAFIGLENSLEALEIRDGFINEESPLVTLSLSHLKKLNLLQLEGNVIPTIGNDWFESGPYKLRDLYLLDSYTKKLGSHAFASLSELRKLSITGGSISEISREMLPSPALYLEMLDLNNNAISTLPKDMFFQMPSLKEIFLESNDFKTIDEIVFSQIWNQLSYVFFYGNPLSCDKDIKWIYKYRLPESLQGHCASPPALRDRSLKNLTLADFS